MNGKDDALVYSFSEAEIREFALFLRKAEGSLPAALEPFMNTLEHYLYNTMSIAEVEEFFSRGKNS